MSNRENSPFHSEAIVARFSDFLHQLCSGVLEHFLRRSFVVAWFSKSGRERRYDTSGCSRLIIKCQRRFWSYNGKVRFCTMVRRWSLELSLLLLSDSGNRLQQSWFHDSAILRPIGRCSAVRARCTQCTPQRSLPCHHWRNEDIAPNEWRRSAFGPGGPTTASSYLEGVGVGGVVRFGFLKVNGFDTALASGWRFDSFDAARLLNEVLCLPSHSCW